MPPPPADHCHPAIQGPSETLLIPPRRLDGGGGQHAVDDRGDPHGVVDVQVRIHVRPSKS